MILNHKQRAVVKYLYQINRYAPAYEVAQATGISLATVKKYLKGSLSKYVDSEISNTYIVDGKEREIIEYKFKTQMVKEYIAKTRMSEKIENLRKRKIRRRSP